MQDDYFEEAEELGMEDDDDEAYLDGGWRTGLCRVLVAGAAPFLRWRIGLYGPAPNDEADLDDEGRQLVLVKSDRCWLLFGCHISCCSQSCVAACFAHVRQGVLASPDSGRGPFLRRLGHLHAPSRLPFWLVWAVRMQGGPRLALGSSVARREQPLLPSPAMPLPQCKPGPPCGAFS